MQVTWVAGDGSWLSASCLNPYTVTQGRLVTYDNYPEWDHDDNNDSDGNNDDDVAGAALSPTPARDVMTSALLVTAGEIRVTTCDGKYGSLFWTILL